MTITPDEFFMNKNGAHLPSHLRTVVEHVREKGKRIMWLVGDGVLSNFSQFTGEDEDIPSSTVPLTEDYDTLLDPPQGVPDVAWFLNDRLEDTRYVAVNCAVQGSTLSQRSCTLTPQDEIVRSMMQPSDILVMCIGYEEIYLTPTDPVKFHMNKLNLTERGIFSRFCQPSISEHYFTNLVTRKLNSYITSLTTVYTPRRIVVCHPPLPVFPNDVQRALSMELYKKTKRSLRGGAENTKIVNLSSVFTGYMPILYTKMGYPSAQGGEDIADKIMMYINRM